MTPKLYGIGRTTALEQPAGGARRGCGQALLGGIRLDTAQVAHGEGLAGERGPGDGAAIPLSLLGPSIRRLIARSVSASNLFRFFASRHRSPVLPSDSSCSP